MNKFLFAVLAVGAAAAAGYVASKLLKDDSQPDYDDDIYDYPDPFDSDESIDFEINDDTVTEVIEDARSAAEKAEDAVEEKAEEIKDAAEEVVDEIKDKLD